jgi:CBS-domain-containing membrane protein
VICETGGGSDVAARLLFFRRRCAHLAPLSWDFIVVPVAAGAALLTAFAWLWHNLLQDAWPERWW